MRWRQFGQDLWVRIFVNDIPRITSLCLAFAVTTVFAEAFQVIDHLFSEKAVSSWLCGELVSSPVTVGNSTTMSRYSFVAAVSVSEPYGTKTCTWTRDEAAAVTDNVASFIFDQTWELESVVQGVSETFNKRYCFPAWLEVSKNGTSHGHTVWSCVVLDDKHVAICSLAVHGTNKVVNLLFS